MCSPVRIRRCVTMTTLRAAMLAALGGACSSNSGPSVGDAAMLQIETSQTTYARGDSVHVTITNVGLTAVRYFPCPLLLDRAAGATWTEVGPLPQFAAGDCDLMAVPLRPGEVTRLSTQLRNSLEAGTYRLRFERLRADPVTPLPLQSRVTNAFSVTM